MELLVASAILVLCLTAVLASFVMIFVLADLSRDTTRAKNAAQAQMEELKKQSFDSLGIHNGTTFEISGFSPATAKGRIEVRDIADRPNLKEIRIIASFRSKNRPIGEDTNFNGILDSGEDTNGNARLDSPVEIVTLITR